ncbi:MAG: hypothetical protein ACRCXK_02415 [Wohlfahrtiimonas sp.]
MRLKYPEFEDKTKMFEYLVKNENDLKKQIISEKGHLNAYTNKAVLSDNWRSEDANVKAIANTFNWCDSHMDVLISGCADKTIAERGTNIKHLCDHNHTTKGIVGITKDIYIDKFFIGDSIAEGIIAESEVLKSYDEKVYSLYKDGQINQHSIGLQYVKIYLCIKSEDPEFELQNSRYIKYYNEIINKDVVDEAGFFWAVTEIKLIEYSTVLLGSNSQTGCITRFKDEFSEQNIIESQKNNLQNIEEKKPFIW